MDWQSGAWSVHRGKHSYQIRIGSAHSTSGTNPWLLSEPGPLSTGGGQLKKICFVTPYDSPCPPEASGGDLRRQHCHPGTPRLSDFMGSGGEGRPVGERIPSQPWA